VPELPERLAEESVSPADIETRLGKWCPETSTDGHTWSELLPPTSRPFAALFASALSRDMEFSQRAELKVFLWPDIVEALEDDKEPPPEQEFVTNSIGHLRQKNFRLAVLESIICLEIVLTQFLLQYLTVSVGVPARRVKQFLSPEIGVTARLSALLNLTLHESYLEDVDLDKVMKVVQWRNEVVHKTGRLPVGIREDTLEDHVSAVLSLVALLAERRDNVAAGPELKKITEALRGMGDRHIFLVQIWLKRSHRVRMDIEFFSAPEPGDRRDKLEGLAREAGELLKARDPRFNGSEHLTIHFKEVPGKSVAWFRAGSLEM